MLLRTNYLPLMSEKCPYPYILGKDTEVWSYFKTIVKTLSSSVTTTLSSRSSQPKAK